MYYAYVLQSESFKRFYIGSTKNTAKRLNGHNRGNTRSTKPYRPWKIVYTEVFNTLHEARLRERQIKSWKNVEYMVKTLGIDVR